MGSAVLLLFVCASLLATTSTAIRPCDPADHHHQRQHNDHRHGEERVHGSLLDGDDSGDEEPGLVVKRAVVPENPKGSTTTTTADTATTTTPVSFTPSPMIDIEARHDFPQHTQLGVTLIDIAELLEDPNSVVYQNVKSLLDDYAPHSSPSPSPPFEYHRDDYNGTKLRIMIQNPELPIRRGTMVDLTPHILARQMHRAMISRGGSVRRWVSVCYRFEPKFVPTEYNHHLRDSEYEKLMYLFQRDNVDVGRGRRQSYMDVLMQELLELNRRHVSLCLEDEHVNHEFAHNSKCINFEAV